MTVDDAAIFIARLTGGALATFEATRFATGRKNAIRIEVNGSRGSLAFDFEDMNVLHVHDATADARESGFTRVVVTEATHPYVEHWWPAGHGLGYEHGFTHQAADLIESIARGADPEPSFADGLAVQEVLRSGRAERGERLVLDRDRPPLRRADPPTPTPSTPWPTTTTRRRRSSPVALESPVIAVTKEQA